jgi:hypothetical protein
MNLLATFSQLENLKEILKSFKRCPNVTQVADNQLKKGDDIIDMHYEIQHTDINPKDLKGTNVIIS